MANEDITFSVVEFIQKPIPSIDKCFAVPDAWIEARGDKVGVLWPRINNVREIKGFFSLNPADTASLNWKEYLSEIVYTAKSYDDARAYILKHTSEVTKKRRHPKAIPSASTSHQDISEVLEKIGETLISCGKQLKDIAVSIKKPLHPRASADTSQYFSAEESETDNYERVPKKKRVTNILPPDYDENDPRWTLKHRKMNPGLEKLAEGYDVFVNMEKLKKILELSQTGEQLITLLLPQIFTESALSTCAVTPNSRRPGLNGDGKNALLAFLKQWESTKNWPAMSKQTFISHITTELNKIRKIRAKTIAKDPCLSETITVDVHN